MEKHIDYRILYLAQRGLCFYCRRPIQPKIAKSKAKNGWTRDHFNPRCDGNGLLGNVVMSCQKCNAGKGSILPSQHDKQRFDVLQEKYTEIVKG